MQKRIMQSKFTTMYEKEIKDLSMQCKRKTDECYEAWMSLRTANEELRKVRMELNNNTFEKCFLGKFMVILGDVGAPVISGLDYISI